ncbi:MAG: hypothetical protein ACPGSB_10745 [Opitutales bacterium]
MNITLSADEDTIRKSREAARRMGKSLNGLLREYMHSVSDRLEGEVAAKKFKQNALEQGGKSESGFRFSRERAHER